MSAPEAAIAQARVEIAEWLLQGEPEGALLELVSQPPEALAERHRELADHFETQAHEGNYAIECCWNPSSLVYDAYWRQNARPIPGLEKPVSAELENDARLLACARLMHFLSEEENLPANG